MTETEPSTDFDGVLLLVGRLNYAWTNTESLLIHLIAGLADTSKDVAVIIFLTLNTTRARTDLVERLAKMDGRDREEREAVLVLTQRLLKLSSLRNRYNHCIYAFDPDGGSPRTILMRIADRKDQIKVGEINTLDADALERIRTAIGELTDVNRAIWTFIKERRYPT